MDRAEQFNLSKKYYKSIKDLAEKYDKECKGLRGRVLFKLGDSLAFMSIFSNIVVFGIGALTLFVAKVPPYISLPSSMIGGLGLGFGSLRFVHNRILKSNGKPGKNYAKFELANYLKLMREYYEKNFKHFLNAKGVSELDKKELEKFIEQTNTYAENFKNYLNKYVGKRIIDKTNKDYQKIEKLYANLTIQNRDNTLKKIEKIIKKNQEYSKEWCEIYNRYGIVANNLYKSTNALDSSYEIPDEKYFSLRDDYLLIKSKQILESIKTYTGKLESFDLTDKNFDLTQKSILEKRLEVEKGKEEKKDESIEF